jgi:DNA-directed RNA polymerase subunit H (RpoH/RPB5)
MDKAKATCLEMFNQRGYTLIENEGDQIIAAKKDDTQIIAFFWKNPKFSVKDIQCYIGLMNELGIYHAVIIYKDNITSFTKKVVLQSQEMEFELFSMADMQYNISKHILQPKFEKLSKEDVCEFKKKYGIKFPVLRKDDPISRFYNYKRGDIIRVRRKNNTITYRIVKG